MNMASISFKCIYFIHASALIIDPTEELSFGKYIYVLKFFHEDWANHVDSSHAFTLIQTIDLSLTKVNQFLNLPIYDWGKCFEHHQFKLNSDCVIM